MYSLLIIYLWIYLLLMAVSVSLFCHWQLKNIIRKHCLKFRAALGVSELPITRGVRAEPGRPLWKGSFMHWRNIWAGWPFILRFHDSRFSGKQAERDSGYFYRADTWTSHGHITQISRASDIKSWQIKFLLANFPSLEAWRNLAYESLLGLLRKDTFFFVIRRNLKGVS